MCLKVILELEHLCKTNHFSNRNKNIMHVKRNLRDFKIQLARKIRTDVLSLYRKMSSLGAPAYCCLDHQRCLTGRGWARELSAAS